MKKIVIPISALIVVCAACLLLLHPVRVQNAEEYRYTIKVTGIKYDLDGGVGDRGGGYCCYYDDDNYTWLTYASAEVTHMPGGMYIKWGFPWQKVTVNMGG